MRPDGHMVINKYFSLPEKLQQEVEDFIDFLDAKYHAEAGRKEQNREKKTSYFGSARGLIVMKDDFDKPLEDFRDYI